MVRNSLAIVPILYLVAALVAGAVIPKIDRELHTPELLGRNPDSVRDVLSSIATGMLTFTGFVVTVVLLLVQFGTATFGPRLIRWARQARLLKHALGMFAATFMYALVTLDDVQRDDETFVPNLTVSFAIVLLVASVVLFFLLLDGITNAMRPAAVGQSIAKRARTVLVSVYPDLDDGVDLPLWSPPGPPAGVVTMRKSHGATVTTIDREAVERYVRDHDVVVELVPAIGEHVREGDTLFRVYGAAAPNLGVLEASVVLGDERNLDDDPAFAFRLLVDVAIKALSPAINDPSTAVQMLDWIDGMLRDAAPRELGGGLYRDESGDVRIVYRTSTWNDLVALAFEEIMWYGRGVDAGVPAPGSDPRRTDRRRRAAPATAARGAASPAGDVGRRLVPVRRDPHGGQHARPARARHGRTGDRATVVGGRAGLGGRTRPAVPPRGGRCRCRSAPPGRSGRP